MCVNTHITYTHTYKYMHIYAYIYLHTCISKPGFVGGLQRHGTNRRSPSVSLYYKKLSRMIMEAEKSHDLPSASWRPRDLVA